MEESLDGDPDNYFPDPFEEETDSECSVDELGPYQDLLFPIKAATTSCVI